MMLVMYYSEIVTFTWCYRVFGKIVVHEITTLKNTTFGRK